MPAQVQNVRSVAGISAGKLRGRIIDNHHMACACLNRTRNNPTLRYFGRNPSTFDYTHPFQSLDRASRARLPCRAVQGQLVGRDSDLLLTNRAILLDLLYTKEPNDVASLQDIFVFR
jgi:hypothetical protein